MAEERSNIIDFPFDAQLRAEATAFAERHGKNPYSDFILAHGRRPDPNQAAAMGRIIGRQVKAADGTMQPRRTRAEKEALREASLARKEIYRIWDHIAQLRAALAHLALIEGEPATIIGEIVACDRPEIDANLQKSVDWLLRFATEWYGHGEEIAHKASHLTSRSLLRFEKVGVQADYDP
jgi:hypothetical protein